MSLSTIIDTLHSTMDTLFGPTGTNYSIIPNPYSLVDNASVFLEEGYGLTIGPEADSEINTLKDDNANRQFAFVLTRQVMKTEDEHNPLRDDSKTILEDQRTFKDRILDFDQLGIPNDIQKINIISVSGINFLVSDKFNFITTNLVFSVDYFTEI